MNTYSIARIGSEYVVLADEQRVLKVASRRKAAKLVVDAAELLSEQSLPRPAQDSAADQSPELGVTPDPRGVRPDLIPAKFLDDSGRFP